MIDYSNLNLLSLDNLYFWVILILGFYAFIKFYKFFNKGFIGLAERTYSYNDHKAIRVEAELVDLKVETRFCASDMPIHRTSPVFEYEVNGEKIRAETKMAWTPEDIEKLPIGTKFYFYVNLKNPKYFDILGIVGETDLEMVVKKEKNIDKSKIMFRETLLPFSAIIYSIPFALFETLLLLDIFSLFFRIVPL